MRWCDTAPNKEGQPCVRHAVARRALAERSVHYSTEAFCEDCKVLVGDDAERPWTPICPPEDQS